MKKKKCNFCGTFHEKENMTVGLTANICKECLNKNNGDLHRKKTKESSKNTFNFSLLPYEIKEKLDQSVIGQEDAKIKLSVAAYHHYKRINNKSDIDIQKSNMFLIGDSGSGKTYLIENLSEILNVPFVIGDATTLTQAGYIGEDVESLVKRLYKKSGNNVEKTEKGIIYIDEIDKVVARQNSSGASDASGLGVQESLLKMLEGTEIEITQDKLNTSNAIMINTKDILFICGGAFVDLDKVIEKRKNQHEKTIGFMRNKETETEKDTKKTVLKEVEHIDLIKYGFIPEFVGRIPAIATLETLEKEDLLDILVKPKNAITKQYEELFKLDDIKLSFSEDALSYVVDKAIERKVGARGLRGILESSLYKITYNLTKNQTKEYIVTRKDFT